MCSGRKRSGEHAENVAKPATAVTEALGVLGASRCHGMAWIIWARRGVIGAPLPVRGNRPERPQRALGRSSSTEGGRVAKEVGGFPYVSTIHRGTGKRVAREDGAAHDCKQTAAQRLSTTLGLSCGEWRERGTSGRYSPSAPGPGSACDLSNARAWGALPLPLA